MRLRLPAAMLALLLPTAAAPEPPSVAAFFANPRFACATLSPSGRRAAVLASHGDTQTVLVRASGDASWTPVTRLEDPTLRFTWLEWESERTLLVGAQLRNPDSVGVRGRATRLFSLDAERKRVRWLGANWPAAQGLGGLVQVQYQDQILHWLPRDAGYVLVSVREPTAAEPSVQRMNVANGKLRTVLAARRDVNAWWADPSGTIRAGEGYERGRYTLWARADGASDFEKVQDFHRFEGSGFSFAAFAAEPTRLLVYAAQAGRTAVAPYDLATRTLGDALFAHAEADAHAVETDGVTGLPTAVVYHTDARRRHFLDAAAAKEYAALEQALGGWIEVVDRSDDRRFALVRTSSETRPPTWYAFDREARALEELFSEHPGLAEAALSPWRAVRYSARDGLGIPAYLTLPPGAEAKKLPVVVLVHGGPTSRVVRGFHPEVQFFASRGFAVFQPDFRGSSGYGDAFRTAGYREWGLAMQDDVTDGVRWLIEQGIADPDRIGIYGGSYGGYAALMGAVKTPELYRAAASYAGVTSLPTLLAEDDWYLFWDDQNRPTVGGGWDDRERLARTSPLENVAKIRIPVLLGHGENDPTVHVKQSRRMAEALREAGKPVEYLEFPHEAHGFLLEANRERWYEALAAFFERYLAARDGAL